MSRRRKSTIREIIPDPIYGDKVLAKFIRSLMVDGKKDVAEKLIYSSFNAISKREKNSEPIDVFKKAITSSKLESFSNNFKNNLLQRMIYCMKGYERNFNCIRDRKITNSSKKRKINNFWTIKSKWK